MSDCGCCEACRADQPDHWVADVWRYCEHHQTMSRRRSVNDPWTIDRRVTPRQAERHLSAAVARMNDWCRRHGTTLADADRLVTWYRERLSKAR